MYDESFNASGSSVVTLGRASVARERVAYPAGGRHAVALPRRLQLALRAERDRSGLARGSAAGEDVELDLLGYLLILRVARKRAGEVRRA